MSQTNPADPGAANLGFLLLFLQFDAGLSAVCCCSFWFCSDFSSTQTPRYLRLLLPGFGLGILLKLVQASDAGRPGARLFSADCDALSSGTSMISSSDSAQAQVQQIKQEEGEETAASFLLTASFPKAVTRRCSVCRCWLAKQEALPSSLQLASWRYAQSLSPTGIVSTPLVPQNGQHSRYSIFGHKGNS